MQLFQGWMLDNLVVPVASQFGMEDEYAYLKASIARFPTGKCPGAQPANVGPTLLEFAYLKALNSLDGWQRRFWHHKVHLFNFDIYLCFDHPKFPPALDVTYSWRLNDLLLLSRSWAGGSCTEGRVFQSSPLWACRGFDGGLGLDQIELWFRFPHEHALNSYITFLYSYYAAWWHLSLPINWRTCEDWCLAGFNEMWSIRNALSLLQLSLWNTELHLCLGVY